MSNPSFQRQMSTARARAGSRPEDADPDFLSLDALAQRTGLSPATIERMAARGEFPRFVRIGARRKAVPLSEYQRWRADPTTYKQPSAGKERRGGA
jgi:predicted DNA-binding transcriptional regulator AlpA